VSGREWLAANDEVVTERPGMMAWPIECRAVLGHRRPVHHGVACSGVPGGVPVAVTEAGLMTYQRFGGPERVPVGASRGWLGMSGYTCAAAGVCRPPPGPPTPVARVPPADLPASRRRPPQQFGYWRDMSRRLKPVPLRGIPEVLPLRVMPYRRPPGVITQSAPLGIVAAGEHRRQVFGRGDDFHAGRSLADGWCLRR
jgi:hypothetical protein